MDITIHPTKLKGSITAIPSKSQAHRLLICAAFSDGITELYCPQTNRDIEATAGCLQALGADIQRTENGYSVTPISHFPASAEMDCEESGSTLRFMLPIAGALGTDTVFHMSGRLPKRPLSPMWEEMERMGCTLTRPTESTIRCQGKLKAGQYVIDGSISSQFITGLLFAAALLPGSSRIKVTGKLESKPYVDMTCQALSAFGVQTDDFSVCGAFPFVTPGQLHVEGDWSNGAFFLAAKYLGSDLTVLGLDDNTAQGDHAVAALLPQLKEFTHIDCGDIPDLVPILAVTAGANKGAVFQNIARLRLKESDRVASVAAMLEAMGCRTETTENELTVHPGKYGSCEINAVGDHRIAMAAAIAATVAIGDITILGAECVSKSYPSFWDEYNRLGGNYEQYIR